VKNKKAKEKKGEEKMRGKQKLMDAYGPRPRDHSSLEFAINDRKVLQAQSKI